MSYHHHRRHKRPSGPRLVIVILCMIAVYGGVLWGVETVGHRIEGKEETEAVGSLEGRFDAQEVTLDDGNRVWTYRQRDLTNILLMGVDWASMEDDRSDLRYDGQADFLLLLTIDRKNKTISTLQIDRDTITPIRIYGPFGDYSGRRSAQICLSHAYGETPEENCENTVWAVSHLLGGIPIKAYMALDMESIAVLNDAVGGITVTLEEDFSAIDPTMTKGAEVTLRGKQAEIYVRGRTGVGDGSNVSRMHRQREFIQKTGDAMVREMSRDMDFVGMLFDRLSNHMITDVNRGWLINKAYESQEYDRLDMRSIAGTHRVGKDGFVEFHADGDALMSLLTETFFE